MSSTKKLLLLFSASFVVQMMCAGTACWASLEMPAVPAFDAEQLAETGYMSSDSAEPLAEEDSPTDSPLNPIGLTTLNGLWPSGASSSSSSSTSPTSGANSSVLFGIAVDPTVLAQNEPSSQQYAQTAILIPSAFQSSLFRPPRLS